jgi:hypothetical protein
MKKVMDRMRSIVLLIVWRLVLHTICMIVMIAAATIAVAQSLGLHLRIALGLTGPLF